MNWVYILMSNMKEWAKKEIEIAIERERGNKDPSEWDYGGTEDA